MDPDRGWWRKGGRMEGNQAREREGRTSEGEEGAQRRRRPRRMVCADGWMDGWMVCVDGRDGG